MSRPPREEKYLPTGDPPVEKGYRLGTKLDGPNRQTMFSFDYDDGSRRSFIAFTYEQALETARLVGLAQGRIAPVVD